MKKPIKLGLWLLGFALLALLGLWLEHERAKARLAAFKAQLIAKGEKLTFAAGAAQRTRAEAAGRGISPWLLVNGSESPFAKSLHLRFAQMEVEREMVVTAMALRRHQLRLGMFPESLRALVPAFLQEVPRDFMDGQPLRYKLQPAGQFLLWSVGEDFKDGGGYPSPLTPPGTNEAPNWLEGRDWVWPQAATEAEVAAYHAELAAKRAGSSPKRAP